MPAGFQRLCPRFSPLLCSRWGLHGFWLCSTGTCSPAVRTAQTRTPAFTCSQISPGDIAKRPMWRRGRSTLSSTRSELPIDLDRRFVIEIPAFLPSRGFKSIFSFCRFEFDVSLQEVQTRKLDVSVKNNKMFYTRERKDIGMVGWLPGQWSVQLCGQSLRNDCFSALVHRCR